MRNVPSCHPYVEWACELHADNRRNHILAYRKSLFTWSVRIFKTSWRHLGPGPWVWLVMLIEYCTVLWMVNLHPPTTTKKDNTPVAICINEVVKIYHQNDVSLNYKRAPPKLATGHFHPFCDDCLYRLLTNNRNSCKKIKQRNSSKF